MESKSFIAYDALFEHVHNECPRFNPRNGKVDFERQQMMALQNRFPNMDIIGCYIHFVRVSSYLIPTAHVSDTMVQMWFHTFLLSGSV